MKYIQHFLILSEEKVTCKYYKDQINILLKKYSITV